jgi:hypothetical protein
MSQDRRKIEIRSRNVQNAKLEMYDDRCAEQWRKRSSEGVIKEYKKTICWN